MGKWVSGGVYSACYSVLSSEFIPVFDILEEFFIAYGTDALHTRYKGNMHTRFSGSCPDVFRQQEVMKNLFIAGRGISEEFQIILEGKDELWNRLGPFLEGDPFGNYTNYVIIPAKH